jgi:hypothetical protein
MRNRLHGAAVIALGALGFALGHASPAAAGEGSAVLESKDSSGVVMNGTRYRVGLSTVIEGIEGNRMRLADLPTLAEGANADAAAVWYEADDDPNAPTAQRIKLTGALPD